MKIIEKHCNGRLIIFVDELDRCRPNYSVEVLERIKHIFSVKGAVYILAVDHGQLVNSISGVYGAQIDAQRYLRKFIDWNYVLPQPNHHQYCRHLYYNVFSFDKQNMFAEVDRLTVGASHFLTFLSQFASVFDVSLRDLDQYFTYLNLVWQTKPKNVYAMEFALATFFKACVDNYEALVNWVPSGQFTESPIQKHICAVIKKLDNAPANIVPEYRTIGWIIALFSVAASRGEGNHICVAENFLKTALPNREDIDNNWIISMLERRGFQLSFPCVRNGLKQLNEVDI